MVTVSNVGVCIRVGCLYGTCSLVGFASGRTLNIACVSFLLVFLVFVFQTLACELRRPTLLYLAAAGTSLTLPSVSANSLLEVIHPMAMHGYG
jgi:hypothetical protein